MSGEGKQTTREALGVLVALARSVMAEQNFEDPTVNAAIAHLRDVVERYEAWDSMALATPNMATMLAEFGAKTGQLVTGELREVLTSILNRAYLRGRREIQP